MTMVMLAPRRCAGRDDLRPAGGPAGLTTWTEAGRAPPQRGGEGFDLLADGSCGAVPDQVTVGDPEHHFEGVEGEKASAAVMLEAERVRPPFDVAGWLLHPCEGEFAPGDLL